ncbi:EAL domain-containing protein [Rhodobacter sphaeroides]|jgi:diguanylate cyclase (GGDEF)-like protein/PAS domain S-box-containing protein|uniref:Diguanylate cyclase/phosphodiesterase n=1 Tax=Cereibacter sphaeroides (strain ATCC 17023 / DSM 158 / JCM 6121 / CCUG 31486 / LMG 2827 / NBRC 12203 / NCIMB 8253 / ATH 2.4.1.) TaxID=272943 RepID=Q3J123_CERS4|nr:EAL domain-containing protein [Cereibacter sphaeroides]ABA79511.1 diguanylate cyclase/phosphodiesterase [Cereibacter sphaeroides 2.4.1]AMJ47801.1 D-glycero-D-manno-heptose 1,7-bisphosphate phosphatase [Cereibacter sphaeroides]ANS34510.1 D-glycero-D-manno-heptose 1,7-bisphosphate phosphatase [Cereibacter sphaeroides]ATN63558.1 D-glycero-D-manno-heptose 1,7-bisphosphate phosphatase [Cereibacter sphaeroides]AXC61723.1 GGDEF domain-containing protein [Cereibacter sphaeroides 2.4.1]
MTGKGQGGSWVPGVVSATDRGNFHASPTTATVLDIIGRILRAPLSATDTEIETALAQVADACSADVAQVCRAGTTGPLEPIHSWVRDGHIVLNIQDLCKFCPGSDQTGPVMLRDLKDLPEGPARDRLAGMELRSLVAVPMLRHGVLAGRVLLGWQTASSDLRPEDLAALQSLAEAMHAAAERRESERLTTEAAAALQEDRLLLESILRTSTSAILAFDADARIVFANDEAAALLGTDANRLPGCTLEGVGCRLLSREGEPLPPEALPVARAIAEGQTLRDLHHVLMAADGRQRILSINAAPVAAGAATAVRVVATIDDVTGQVSADSALRTALAEAHQLAFFDPLTGLYNRRGIVEVLRDCLQTCAREKAFLSLLYIDLDGMRQVNGTRGHWLGDRVLQALGARLDNLRQDGGDLGRISADEFVLTCGETHPDAAGAVAAAEAEAQRILESLREPFVVDGLTLEVTASIGLAAISAEDSVEGLLKGVDLAVMAAKAAGGDRACAYRADMEQDMVGRVALAQELREAIRRDEFRIYFEPMVSLGETGLEIVGQEALIRWEHPQRGLLAPIAFIPFAEETGFIRDIDRWVLRAAAQELARWAEDPARRHLGVSINISSAQFLSEEFGQMVREVLDETGVDPTRIELEVTEGTLLSNLGLARTTMMDLRSLGISIALDDFGTGFSSLSYLRDLPVDVLKIDRSFLGGLSDSKANRTILEGIIGLASGLGVALVAEGVETPAQFAWLRAKGCRTFQGYLFGRPVDEAQTQLAPEVSALGGHGGDRAVSGQIKG